MADPATPAEDERKEALRIARRLRRVEETLQQVESLRDTNARLLDRLMRDLDAERTRSRNLLLNVLPEAIVERLDAGETLIADAHQDVAVVISDFVGFTGIASELTPPQLVEQLNALFSHFDTACAALGVEKIKTIGDGYLAVSGLEPGAADPVIAAAELALRMRSAVAEAGGRWQVRIGIHAGPIVAGVIGSRKFAYDVWGDTVNVASRLESTSQPGAIHISEAVAQRLRAGYVIEPRGSIELKGKGATRTWFLMERHQASESPS